jgi:uncharacterized protein YlxP (DUF503 family)
MVIGIARITLVLPGSRSLKQKRGVIQSVKDRIKNEYNVSVSEVDREDQHGMAVIGIACISRNGELLQKTFDQLGETLHKRRDLVIQSYEIEIES